MNRRRLIATIALLAAGMGGCATYSLEELRHTTPQGTPFQNALSRFYMAFAMEEEREYDWFNSMHFADKGLRAAYGKDVQPEALSDWDIPKEVLPDMEKARARLMATLTPVIIQAQPVMAAQAQFDFDCWAEQQEENWQEDDIARCRDGLRDTLDALNPLLPLAPAKPSETMPDAAAAASMQTPQGVDTEAYVVFFLHGQAALSASGRKVIDEVLQTLENQQDYDIVLSDQSTMAGKQKASLALSQARAQAVRQRLIQGGIQPESIRTSATGESDAPDKTAQQGGAPANRRVEIFLNE